MKKISIVMRVGDALTIPILFFVLASTYRPKRSAQACAAEGTVIGAVCYLCILLLEPLTNQSIYAYMLNFLVFGALFSWCSLKARMPCKLMFVFLFCASIFQIEMLGLVAAELPLFHGSVHFRIVRLIGSILIAWFLSRNSILTVRPVPPAYWLSIVITALIGLIHCLIITEYCEDLDLLPKAKLMVPAALSSIAVEMIVFWLCRVLIADYEDKMVQVTIKNRQESDSHLVQEHDRLANELKSMRHEANNHNTMLKTLLEHGDADKAQAYLEALLRQERPSLSAVKCGNKYADAILSQKKAQAERLGIPMRIEAYLSEDLPIDPTDLCSLLSNLISNALEASEQVSGPDIEVFLHPVKNYISLKVRNAVDSNVLASNPELATTKNDPCIHGMGLKIVERVAARYAGITHFEVSDGYFTAEVLLLMREG